MARNRQRAKDRKQRLQSDRDAGRPADEPLLDPSLAGGAPPDDLGTAAPPVDFDDDEPFDDDVLVDEDESAREHVGAGAGDVATPTPTRKGSGLARVPAFLRACWAELQRVQWPDRRQVGQATAVVLGFVIVAGAFLGLADVVAQRIVDLIL